MPKIMSKYAITLNEKGQLTSSFYSPAGEGEINNNDLLITFEDEQSFNEAIKNATPSEDVQLEKQISDKTREIAVNALKTEGKIDTLTATEALAKK